MTRRRYSLRIEPELGDALDRVAEGTGVSVNRYLETLIARHLESCQLIPPAPSARPAARARHPWKGRAVLPSAPSLRGRER